MSWRGLRTLTLEVGTAPDYSQIWRVVKLILIFPHGKASVERGFCVNRNVEKHNFKEETFVSLRVICGHIRAVGGLANVKIDVKASFCSASSAGSKYMYRAQMDDHQHQQKTDAQSRKSKQMCDEIDAVMEKKTCIEKEVAELQNGIEDFSTRAEEKRNLSFLTLSHTLRKTVKGKLVILIQFEQVLKDKMIAF